MATSNARLAVWSAVSLCVVTLSGVYAQAPNAQRTPEPYAQPEPPLVPLKRELRLPGAPLGAGVDATVGEVPFIGSGDEKTATWTGDQITGSCRIARASLTIKPDGTGTFKSKVASGGSGDSYCMFLVLRQGHDGIDLYTAGGGNHGVCSGTLSLNYSDFNFDIQYPGFMFPNATIGWRRDHC